jgi:hypothetical protein
MRTSRAAALVAAALALGACNPETMGGGPTRQKVTVAGRAVTIAAPPGFCIDEGSTRVDGAGAFVLMRDCDDGPEARPPRAALTASVSSGGLTGEGDAASDTLLELGAFLATSDGRALVGRSARAGGVRVLAQQVTNDVLFVLVEDRGPQPIAGLDRTFWRAFLEVNDRMTVLSVLGFDGGIGPEEGLRQLAALASAIRGANPG